MKKEYYISIVEKILDVKGIGENDNFFALGGDSFAAVNICDHLSEIFKVPFDYYFLFERPIIKDQLAYIQKIAPQENDKIQNMDFSQIDQLSYEFLEKALSKPSVLQQNITKKNESTIFILCAPRTGSTLLRVMLGSHPLLFAPPELHLFSYQTLGERKNILSTAPEYLEGVILTIKELKQCSIDEAKQIMQNLESQNTTVMQFFALLQQWAKPRIFTEKTPRNTLNLNTLKTINSHFSHPRYIVLVRHPLAVIPSLIELSEKFFINLYRDRQSQHKKGLRAEFRWLLHNFNILKFMESSPTSKFHVVQFEQLVTQPQQTMQDICSFLNIDYCEAMVKPYENKKGKMLDGVDVLDFALGDYKFQNYSKIDSRVADSWKRNEQVIELSPITWEIAQKFGYERPVNGK